MVIRPIRRDELAAFANFSNSADINEHFLAYLTNMCNSGYVCPEWCFVAEEAGAFIGRIVYWTLSSLSNFFIIDFLEVPWSANYLEVGTKLLRDSWAQLPVQDSATIQYQLDTPSRM